MNLEHVVIPTIAAKAGMSAGDVLRECARCQIPAIPFVDAQGKIAGRVTVKNIVRTMCIPDHLVTMAHLLDDDMAVLRKAESRITNMMEHPVESFIQETKIQCAMSTPLIKVLAVMEQSDTSYMFVVENGQYRGVLTIPGIASQFMEMDGQREPAPTPQQAGEHGGSG